MRKVTLFVLLIFAFILIGCSGPQKTPLLEPDSQKPNLPAAPVTFTVPAETGTVTPPSKILVPIGTLIPTEAQATINPTYFNFPTPTPTPTLDPSLILLRIVSPGPMSKVVSPIEFVAHIAPAYTGVTRIELIGEDGVELYRKVFKSFSNIGYYTRIDEKITFQINGAAEVARLQISTEDSKGRIQAFNSVRLLLQTVGENEFSPPYAPEDRTVLKAPLRDDIIGGGNLIISGIFQPANNEPVIVEIIDDQGNSLGTKQLQFDKSSRGYQQFSVNIPYSVSKLVSSLLVIRQKDDRIDGLAYLFSIPIVIGP